MKRLLPILLLMASLTVPAWAATTISAVNKYSYGANFAWMDWRGDTNNGAVIGINFCSGYIYAANVGWVHLGGGAPANSIQYQNNTATDYGVNHDGLGNLRGYAYAANIGWVNFENVGAPKVNLITGTFSGYVYSANCGWISLSNAFAHVQTTVLSPGPLAANGLPIAWLMTYFGTTNVSRDADLDGDGMANWQEYLAGTNPNDASDKLVITTYSTTFDGTAASLTWNSTPTRFYNIEQSLGLTTPLWFDSGLGLITPNGTSTTRNLTDTNAPTRLYRVRAVTPLSP